MSSTEPHFERRHFVAIAKAVAEIMSEGHLSGRVTGACILALKLLRHSKAGFYTKEMLFTDIEKHKPPSKVRQPDLSFKTINKIYPRKVPTHEHNPEDSRSQSETNTTRVDVAS